MNPLVLFFDVYLIGVIVGLIVMSLSMAHRKVEEASHQEISLAFGLGYSAFHVGQHFQDNPYDTSSARLAAMHLQWAKGWTVAYKEDYVRPMRG